MRNKIISSLIRGAWVLFFLALIVVPPQFDGKAQQSICLFQNPLIGGGEVLALHDFVQDGWPGVDSLQGSVRTIFADPNQQRVYFAGVDLGGANGVIIDGTGPCAGWRFGTWHGNDSTTWVKNLSPSELPNTILMTPGRSGITTGSHNHIAVLFTSNISVCGKQGMWDVDSQRWGYDFRDIVNCYGDNGFDPSASTNPDSGQILSAKTYQFARHGSPEYVHNMLQAFWLPTNSWIVAPIPTDSNGNYSFQGGFTFEDGVKYYFNGTSGTFTESAGYKTVPEDCNGFEEGCGVCDSVSIEADVLSTIGPCFVIDPDGGFGHNGVELLEITSERSIAVSMRNVTGVINDSLKPVGSDVLFQNTCGYPVTLHWIAIGTDVTFWMTADRNINTSIPSQLLPVDVGVLNPDISASSDYLDGLLGTPTAPSNEVSSQPGDPGDVTTITVNNPTTGQPVWSFNVDPSKIPFTINWQWVKENQNTLIFGAVVVIVLLLVLSKSDN